MHTAIYKQPIYFKNIILLEKCFNDMDLCGSAQDNSWKLHFIPLSSRSVVDFFTILGSGSREIIPMMGNVKLMEWICECLLASESLLLLLTQLKYEFNEALSHTPVEPVTSCVTRRHFFVPRVQKTFPSPFTFTLNVDFFFMIPFNNHLNIVFIHILMIAN